MKLNSHHFFWSIKEGFTMTTGRELVKLAFRREPVERVPWVPFVGAHGGVLVGATATEYLKSADLMVKGAAEAVRRYRPDGIPVMFDLQVEAEALGCKLAWADDNPPAVISHPLEEGRKLADLKLPELTAGRIPVALEAARQMRAAHPDLALYGLITGPFTLALHLLGTNIFMKMFDDPEGLKELLAFCRDVGIRMADAYLDAGCDIVAIVDPMTSQIDPESFQTFVSEPVGGIVDRIRERGGLSSIFVCGNAVHNIKVMCDCRPDNLSIDENIPLPHVRELALANGVSFGGNLKLTVVLLLGTADDARRDAVDCLDAGGKTGFILAPGCDLAMATPPANLEAVAEIVHDPYRQDVVRATRSTIGSGLTPADLSTHWRADAVVVDLVTLDSASCAPCQYMVEAVRAAAAVFGHKVVCHEHKVKQIDGLRVMLALGVHNIPTICMDGEIVFVSIIPSRDKLIAAIRERLAKKLWP
jgi:uroporphyrinogen decarboxylase